MATKAKTSGSSTPAASHSLADTFSEGLSLLDAGKLAEAARLFQQLEADAAAQGEVALARAVRTRLAAVQTRLEKVEAVKAAPEMIASLHLNRQEPEEALAVVEKALGSRKADPKLNYLKALALAQKQDADGCAKALKEALDQDPNLIHLFRSERDFDPIRNQAPLAVFELE